MLNTNKEKLMESLNEKISYLESENTIESQAQSNELKELIYVINKGCFDVK